MTIKLNKNLVKGILYLTKIFPENKVLIMCKGYGDDHEFYTQLSWNEDSDLDFVTDNQYYDFELWTGKK